MNAPAPASSRTANPLAPYLALAALWLLTITIVPPRGNFPLNDDWMYAKVVQNLVDTGRYEANPYIDPTFILQAYWGAAFVKILGFSFEALRISTLVLALAALWAAHWCAREAGLNTRWAFLVALTLMVNPLFLNLSYTFMTDVPFIALTTLSAAAFLRGLRTQHAIWITVGSGVAVCAFFIRQFGVLVPVAFLPALISFRASAQKGPRVIGLASPVVAFIAPWLIAAALYNLLPIGGLGASSGWDWTTLGESLFARVLEILRHLGLAFTYLTILCAPIAIASLASLLSRRSASPAAWAMNHPPLGSSTPCHSEQSEESPPRPASETTPKPSLRGGPPPAAYVRDEAIPGGPARHSQLSRGPILRTAVLAALALLIAWLIIPEWPHRLPNLGNLLLDLGVGPLLMPGMLDGYTIMAPVRLGAGPWWLITALAIPGAAALAALHLRASLGRLTRAAFRDATRRSELFLALWSLAMLLVLIMPPVLAQFDRYFVMAQVPATILAARWLAARSPQPARTAYIAAAAIHLFGLVCLQDYLAWNAARWKALDALHRGHAAPLDQINGGYEFNGWYHSDHFAEESRRTRKKVFGPLGWWTIEDNYRVSLRPGKHFQIIGTEPYFSWLGFQRREMLLLKRTEPDPPL